MASDLKLRGVGPFCYTHLEYETVLARSQAAEMWKVVIDIGQTNHESVL